MIDLEDEYLSAVSERIAALRQDEQERVRDCAASIRRTVQATGEYGPLALALVSAEFAAGALDQDE